MFLPVMRPEVLLLVNGQINARNRIREDLLRSSDGGLFHGTPLIKCGVSF